MKQSSSREVGQKLKANFKRLKRFEDAQVKSCKTNQKYVNIKQTVCTVMDWWVQEGVSEGEVRVLE